MMILDELFQLVVDRHFDLIKLDTLKFRRETALEILQQYDEVVDRLYVFRRELFREILIINTPVLQAHTAALRETNDKLKETIDDVTKIADTLKNLVKLIAAVEKIISIASSVAGIPASGAIAAGMEAKSAAFSSTKAHFKKAGLAEMLAEPSVEEKAPLFLIEEVLHGVELKREKLIITVATGGCTNEGSFRFDVNKGTGGQQPYTVTVYRIEPDDCKAVLEPIQLSYSREELGLDGHVEFILRNKIGNTSQHRLNS